MSFTKWKLRLAIYFIERNETKLSPVPGWLERSPCVGSSAVKKLLYLYEATTWRRAVASVNDITKLDEKSCEITKLRFLNF